MVQPAPVVVVVTALCNHEETACRPASRRRNDGPACALAAHPFAGGALRDGVIRDWSGLSKLQALVGGSARQPAGADGDGDGTATDGAKRIMNGVGVLAARTCV